jgi:hypothetical protein
MTLTDLTCRITGKPEVGRVFAIRTDKRAYLTKLAYAPGWSATLKLRSHREIPIDGLPVTRDYGRARFCLCAMRSEPILMLGVRSGSSSGR